MMATLNDPEVRELLTQPNHAVVSTVNANGSLHSTVVWISDEGDGSIAVNSAVGRLWPTNLTRDPRVTVLVAEEGNPYNFIEIRGRATGTLEGADEHINRLSMKYTNRAEFGGRRPGEQRIKFVITPERIRHRR
jgi:PPOX class probable F420-dependent enzyme